MTVAWDRAVESGGCRIPRMEWLQLQELLGPMKVPGFTAVTSIGMLECNYELTDGSTQTLSSNVCPSIFSWF
jgi:hypothetical protein